MSHRNRYVVPAFVIALAAVGCHSSSSESQANDAASASASTSSLATPPVSAVASTPRPHPHRPHMGPAGTLFGEAGKLKLSDDVKAKVDKIDDDAQVDETLSRTAWHSFQTDLAASVRAGKMDTAKLKDDQAAIDKSTLERQMKDAQGLNELHETLDPASRKELVTTIQTHEAEREAHRPPIVDAGAVDAGGIKADMVKRKLDRMTMQLTLDPDQQKKIGAILAKEDQPTPAQLEAKKDEAKKKYDAVIAAFGQDKFDATKMEMFSSVDKTSHEPMEKDIAFVSSVITILKPEQREKLAVEHERGGGRGGPMGGGMGERPGGGMMGPGGPGFHPRPMPGGPGGPGMAPPQGMPPQGTP
jgi:Spy/CpxP family protein refolding chaperone